MTDKKIGLALSGGGARGFAHIGVLKALEENKITIDMVAGTSAGSFVGAAFATGLSADEIYRMAAKIKWSNVVGFSYSHRGLLTNAPMGKFIKDNFPVYLIEEMPVPYAAVACDITTGDEVVFQHSGDVSLAVRASCAVPGVFAPVIDEDERQLVDGGIIAPIPTRTVKKMGADIIIAVDLLTSGIRNANPPANLVATLLQSAMMLVANSSKNQHFRADIVIEPEIEHIRPDQIKKMDELYELGYKAAVEKISDIKGLL